MRRRDLLKKSFALGAIATFFNGCSTQGRTGAPVFSEGRPTNAESAVKTLVDDVNFYFYSVFTHVMSLRKRRCLEVDIRAVKEASYQIVAIMDGQLKDFEITKWEIKEDHGKIYYEAVFIIGERFMKVIKSHFYFGLLGGPGDPVWIEKNAGRYVIGRDGKARYLSLRALDAIKIGER